MTCSLRRTKFIPPIYMKATIFRCVRSRACWSGPSQLNSFSKNFLMTGWRVGVIIAEPALLCVMNQVNGALIYSAPSISQRAAIAALENRARIREALLTAYRERIFYSTERLEKLPYLSLVAPKGTFYLFPGVEKTGLSSGEFCKGAAGAGAHPRLARRRVRHCGQAALPHRMHREYRQTPRGRM